MSLESEKQVLGAVLDNPMGINKVIQRIKPKHFGSKVHRAMYSTALELFEGGIAITPNTLVVACHSLGLCEEDYITELYDNYDEDADLDYFLTDILETSHTKSTSRAVQEALDSIEDGSTPMDVLTSLTTIMEQIVLEQNPSVGRNMKEISEDYDIYAPEVITAKTGFRALDTATGGLKPADYWLIAAKPSCGKTAFILQMARNVARQGVPVWVVSYEMPYDQLYKRLLYSEAKVSLDKYRAGMLTETDYGYLEKAKKRLNKLPITILQGGFTEVEEIVSKARVAETKPVILVDYLQLVPAPREKDIRLRVDYVSARLKNAALALGIPVVVVSAVSRTQDKELTMHKLKESGGLEFDGDIIVLMWKDNDGDREVVFDVAKQRNGGTTRFKLEFRPQIVSFVDRTAFDSEGFR